MLASEEIFAYWVHGIISEIIYVNDGDAGMEINTAALIRGNMVLGHTYICQFCVII